MSDRPYKSPEVTGDSENRSESARKERPPEWVLGVLSILGILAIVFSGITGIGIREIIFPSIVFPSGSYRAIPVLIIGILGLVGVVAPAVIMLRLGRQAGRQAVFSQQPVGLIPQ